MNAGFTVSEALRKRISAELGRDWAEEGPRAAAPAQQLPQQVRPVAEERSPAPKRKQRGAAAPDAHLHAQPRVATEEGPLLAPLGLELFPAAPPPHGDLLLTVDADQLAQCLGAEGEDVQRLLQRAEELLGAQGSVQLDIAGGLLRLCGRDLPFAATPLDAQRLRPFELQPAERTLRRL